MQGRQIGLICCGMWDKIYEFAMEKMSDALEEKKSAAFVYALNEIFPVLMSSNFVFMLLQNYLLRTLVDIFFHEDRKIVWLQGYCNLGKRLRVTVVRINSPIAEKTGDSIDCSNDSSDSEENVKLYLGYGAFVTMKTALRP